MTGSALESPKFCPENDPMSITTLYLSLKKLIEAQFCFVTSNPIPDLLPT
ncbi:MAG TPA: hypothetical protein VE971_01025 [Candidatus Eisenbacteria bacterium]|nr:hypothetical protein [Candidatus Eisenbacteria bacterium]